MRRHWLNRIVLGGVGIGLLGVLGCDYDRHHGHRSDVGVAVATPAPDPYYPQAVYAPVAPPAPVYEDPGPPPSVDYVWIGGAWDWDDHNRHYHWNRGRWEHRPRPEARWEHDEWHHTERGWEHNRGEWR